MLKTGFLYYLSMIRLYISVGTYLSFADGLTSASPAGFAQPSNANTEEAIVTKFEYSSYLKSTRLTFTWWETSDKLRRVVRCGVGVI